MQFSLEDLPNDDDVRVYAAVAVAAIMLDGFYKIHNIKPGDSLDKVPKDSKINLNGVTAENARYIWTALMWLARDRNFNKCIYVSERTGFNPRDEFKFLGGYKSTSLYKSVFTPIIGEHKVEYTPDEVNKCMGHHAPNIALQKTVAFCLAIPLINSFFLYNKNSKELEFNSRKSIKELQRLGYIKLSFGLMCIPSFEVEKLKLRYLHAAKIFGFDGCKSLLQYAGCRKELDLGDNDLVNLGAKRLKELFGVIPLSVTHLCLSLCEFNKLTADDLAYALSGIPATVTFLDLSFNDLNKFTKDELKKIVKAISSTIKIDLTNNGLDEDLCRSLEQRTSLVEALSQRKITSMPLTSAPEASASSSGQNFFPKQGTSSAQSTDNSQTYGIGKP